MMPSLTKLLKMTKTFSFFQISKTNAVLPQTP